MLDFVKKWLVGSNEAEVKKLQKIVDRINELEPSMQKLSDEQLRAKTDEFKAAYKSGKTLDDLLPEAFAVVREAAVRVLGQRPFDTQLLGATVVHQGRIAEMKTGEGKTLVAPIASYLNALTGEGVHVVTVNDYLAKFHSEWMGKLHRFLGVSVGLVLHDMNSAERQEAYNCDITYATNNELGFDYLRDNMVVYKEERVQRGLTYAIIDEVDSILIDEARTPLIISGQGDKSTDMYTQADNFVLTLKEEEDYTKDEKQHSVILTEEGIKKAERYYNLENLSDLDNTEINHHINQALRAHALMKRDVDYVVQDDQVVIVDEFTGRLMTGRRYSEGLHQAIEAKEHVKVERESKTLATITFQNYFRMYKKIAGMTGTAKTEEDEFKSIYGLDVVQIPTNRPMIRKDLTDVVYRTQRGKYRAVVDEIVERNKTGQPVLVGTISVEISEMISDMLARRGVRHEVLNAKHHRKEAEIVAQAGHEGAVTIATNMAGRGTDILLGGNPEFLARQRMAQDGMSDELIELGTGHMENAPDEVKEAQRIFAEYFAKFKKETDRQHDHVVELGGLHIIGTERHESRRIDNQLRGRAGRQGDPGSSRFYISLEDELMRLFGSDRIMPLVDRLGLQEDEPIEYGMLSKQIENAQKRVEARNFDTRKHVLQYDDVMNTQRTVIYEQRKQVLEGEDMRGAVIGMIHTLNETAVEAYAHSEEWDLEGLQESLGAIYLPKGALEFTEQERANLTKENLVARLNDIAETLYKAREDAAREAGFDMRAIEREVMLRIVDQHWMDHIDDMDRMRQGIGLRAIGHRDPVVEYKFEGYEMFEAMVKGIQDDTLRYLFHINFVRPIERKVVAVPVQAVHAESAEAAAKQEASQPRKRNEPRVGRNDPCPCGSGKKFKHCHGANA